MLHGSGVYSVVTMSRALELRSCVKVEVDVLSKPTVSADVKQHFSKEQGINDVIGILISVHAGMPHVHLYFVMFFDSLRSNCFQGSINHLTKRSSVPGFRVMF